MTINPIETRYAGCRFRSRLEARHAVFFDHLGLQWEYEPQGFHTSAGPYLPDFRILQGGVEEPLWIEVRPVDVSRDLGPFLAFGFNDETGEVLHQAYRVGDLPDPKRIVDDWGTPGVGEALSPADDGAPYFWCVCASGQHVGIEFEARGHRIKCACNRSIEGDWGHTARHPRLLEAFAAARSARFEHGESG
ncbi:hypothetical protein Sme01_03730 [Sphaerisporangium melleum]|uniref:Uncharacterized protein n=1 Tax=Sphaerisporangium melleum TaxID=321316 RepID=A0A917QP51_9ACTN|nr:hypothetical protein [Sphaerisporangium melleum]GGK61876.1 hypothetical protein GCM10007964_01280 [Sphaerisporangium melleum]GII67897.1 hypothetical protein Sme01_03730 [Sphaerisporangium melleum]